MGNCGKFFGMCGENMSMSVCNKNYKCCALCRNWYDPTNSAIEPVNPAQGMWEFDTQAKKCLLNNGIMPGFVQCNKFMSKL